MISQRQLWFFSSPAISISLCLVETVEKRMGQMESKVPSGFAAVDTPSNELEFASKFLRRYPDPWERVEAEMNHALKDLIPTQKDGRPQSEAECDSDVYQKWFDLVSEQEHVRSERDGFGAAWVGALKYRKCTIN